MDVSFEGMPRFLINDSVFLGDITKAFQTDPNLVNLLLDPFFTNAVQTSAPSFRRVVSQAMLLGVPVPCFASALTFFDGYRTARGGANLLQAQRDYFGAHTYEVWNGLMGVVGRSTGQVDPY